MGTRGAWSVVGSFKCLQYVLKDFSNNVSILIMYLCSCALYMRYNNLHGKLVCMWPLNPVLSPSVVDCRNKLQHNLESRDLEFSRLACEQHGLSILQRQMPYVCLSSIAPLCFDLIHVYIMYRVFYKYNNDNTI